MRVWLVKERRELISGVDRDFVAKKYGTHGFDLKVITKDEKTARLVMQKYYDHYVDYFKSEGALKNASMGEYGCDILYSSKDTSYVIYFAMVDMVVIE